MKPLIVCLFFLSACSTNSTNTDRLDYLAGLNDPDYVQYDSKVMGRPFHIFTRLPESFEKGKKYSVVYLLDGDIAFPLIASYHLLLSIDEPTIDDAIIVGISYGTHDPENGNFRRTDYSIPSEGETGRADDYQTFLKSELLPYIEKNYPADPEKRIILGQSRGGHFVLYTALTQPDLFWGHIVSNPSLSPDKAFFFTDHKHPPSIKTNLFFANGANDWHALRADSLELFEHLAKQDSPPWRLKTITLTDETHAAGLTNVYRAGMKWLFSDGTDEEQKSLHEKTIGSCASLGWH